MYKSLVQMYKSLELNMCPLKPNLVMVMSGYRREMVLAVVLAVILVASLALASNYFFPQTQPPIPTPAPSPTPTPTLTPSPTSTPTPKPVPTSPTPPPPFTVVANYTSADGFDISFGSLPGEFNVTMLRLPAGGSGTVPITLSSTSDEDLMVSLVIEPIYGLAPPEDGGVSFTFTPNPVVLKAGQRAYSTLKAQVAPDAPTALYTMPLRGKVGELVSYARGFHLLVSPYSPSHTFIVHALPETPETTPAPTPTPTPGATPTSPPPPTPVPTPTPRRGPTYTPETPKIEIQAGKRVHIMFVITTPTVDPNLSISISLGAVGPTPPGISWEVIPDPLEVVPHPTYRVYIMSLTASPDALEGTYNVFAWGNVDSYRFERAFYLVVKGS